MENAYCKRCQIKLDAIVRAAIVKQLEEIPQEEVATDEEYERRMQVCRSCRFLMGETCSASGFFACVRAAAVSATCPNGLWE